MFPCVATLAPSKVGLKIKPTFSTIDLPNMEAIAARTQKWSSSKEKKHEVNVVIDIGVTVGYSSDTLVWWTLYGLPEHHDPSADLRLSPPARRQRCLIAGVDSSLVRVGLGQEG
ncbi:hypothetical protein WICPIJ_006448 [Wickerhamomyces pijperi]|uniref:Uncharacterized protein n=1 Tax=Wickerhamomyces pijperi TaxID=599730 RepID=A0A9P8Q1M2_WICPI|nr:hypothetical protein WICPIJ_006448 [Wickerhamomyces pijperi]